MRSIVYIRARARHRVEFVYFTKNCCRGRVVMGDSESRPSTPEPPEPTPGPSQPGPIGALLEIDTDLVQKESHTSNWDLDDYVILRRGNSIRVTLHSKRQSLLVTKVVLEDAHDSRNSVEIVHSEDRDRSLPTSIALTLAIPENLPVGEYRLRVSGRSQEGGEFRVSLKRICVVLFNAWSRSDAAYMDDEAERYEYVANTNGRVYAGRDYYGKPHGVPWKLALYRPATFRAVLLLLRKASLTFEQRRSVVKVSREMSALVNVQDDRGVLVGNWSGNYEDGTSPSAWNGSGKILQEYFESGGEPVRYGQCWVFSGVLLSVLRVLGIPARSITNYASAHDTNRNRTIDEYTSEETGEKISYLSNGSDSIWNFHVWNEAWMKRSDLPPGFGGWQVLDATPQEESPQGGGYRAGPAPIKAIKEGNSLNYDVNFVIAEVNADIKKYKVDKDGVPKLYQVDMTTVGRDISTKAVASSDPVDVTNEYKHPEGNRMERTALYEGYEELLKQTQDVTFKILDRNFEFGQDAVLTVEMSNKAKQHVVRGTILCQAVTYTNRVLRDVDTLKVDVKINKGKTETVAMTVGGSIFSEFPSEKVYLRFSVYLAVISTSQIFSETKELAPALPPLKILVPSRLALGARSEATVVFKNPLSVKMEDIILSVEGDGLLNEDIEHAVGAIEAGATFTYPFTIYGLEVGNQEIVGRLDSKQVELVSGEAEVTVDEGEDTTDGPTYPGTVTVVSVETNTSINKRVHHTDDYDGKELILRRGQLFSLTLHLATPISETNIVTTAMFSLLGYRNRKVKSFEVAAVSRASGTELTVELNTPSGAEVGKYVILLKVGVGENVTVVDTKLTAILLFNPWNSEDKCYYPETSDLEEYVLSDRGRIWVGSSDSNYGRPWQFAQFTAHALQVAVGLLERLPAGDRADPVKVSRHIAAMVNVQDDNGILVGNWSGDYEGGHSPLYWTGSDEILEEFSKTWQPVKYAQCWVFSGVSTSLLRCVGLPARSVSNFNSAHDTEFNRAIDYYYNEEGDKINSGDSIWNFHVWNEAWMTRNDLPPGFGGWQALDATPQEESPQGGGFRLGPCPIRAVKLGVRMNYDVEFVLSEVNADVRRYLVRANGDKELLSVNTRHVGKQISTKAVGSPALNDITNEYKFREGTQSERTSVLAKEVQNEMEVELSISPEVLIGQSFVVVVKVTNKTRRNHDYSVAIRGRAMLYTGITGQVVKSSTNNMITVRPGQTGDVQLNVTPQDYLKLLEGGNFIHFVAMVKADNDISAVETHNLRLRTPDIDIKLPEGGLKLYQPAEIHVSFRNPMSKTLYNGRFELLGETHLQSTSTSISAVPPRNVAEATMTTIPLKKGPVEVVVRFSSSQLSNIVGSVETTITA